MSTFHVISNVPGTMSCLARAMVTVPLPLRRGAGNDSASEAPWKYSHWYWVDTAGSTAGVNQASPVA